ncbi:MAG: DUF5689 domain-containing protein [Mediterranea sp.]|jgi:hypothetical protein|nr:DUF5689 domain-containing protein [Mediterranea sp.]
MKQLKISKLLYVLMLAVTSTLLVNCVDDNDDKEAPYFEVSPTTLNFDLNGQPASGSQATFDIKTNRPWKITVPEELTTWLSLSQTEGDGPATIKVTVPETSTARTANITVAFSNKVGVLKSQVVTINCGAVAPTEIIYNEPFGNGTLSSPYPYIDQYQDWQKTGTGASEVTYAGNSTSIRSSNASGGYNGASGGNSVFFGTAPADFTIQKIALTSSQTNLRLTFGGQHQVTYQQDYTFEIDQFTVALSADGTTWSNPITYTKAGDETVKPNWILATADFTLKQPVSYLYVKFSLLDAHNTRLDDITLATGNGGQEVDLEGGVTPQPPTTNAIFSEDMGATAVSGNTDLSTFNGWSKAGSGASAVTYEGTSKVQIRTSSASTDGYTGASGGNNVFFGADAPSSFIVKNIALTSEQTKLKLTFGALYVKDYDAKDYTFDMSKFEVNVSADGTNWQPLTYTKNNGDANKPNYIFATADFTLKAAVSSLYIKFTATEASKNRLDDITLDTGNGGQEIDLSTSSGPVTTTAISIPDLIAKMTATATSVDDNYILTGVVCGDPAGLNYSYGTLYLMTKGATTAGNGISLYNSNIDMTQYKLGQEIEVTLLKSNASIKKNYDVPQVSGFAATDIKVLSENNAVTPITVALADLASYVCMPVTIENATSPAAGTWKDVNALKNHTFNVSGTDFVININKQATPFDGQTYAAKTASISGIASIYQSKGQLMPRNLDDVKNFASTDPMVTAITPASYTFPAAGGTYDFTAAVANSDGTGLSVSGLSAPLSATINGKTITVTALANTTGAVIEQTMTVTLGTTSVTAAVKIAAPSTGNDTKGTYTSMPQFLAGTIGTTSSSPDKLNTAGLTDIDCAKLGTSKLAGVYTTAALGVTGDKKLSFYAAAWKGKTATKVYIQVNNGGSIIGDNNVAVAANDGATNTSPYTITFADSDYYTFNLTGLTVDSTITISTDASFSAATNSNGRAIMCGFQLY